MLVLTSSITFFIDSSRGVELYSSFISFKISTGEMLSGIGEAVWIFSLETVLSWSKLKFRRILLSSIQKLSSNSSSTSALSSSLIISASK
jgi:hypothetical protein